MVQETGRVVATHLSPTHTFSKLDQFAITLVEGQGVRGDAHMGETVKHRSRVAKDPTQPNLRQVHLVPVELHRQLDDQGFDVTPGQMGENITTEGIDLNSLPVGTVLSIGADARVEMTGLRNPCGQLNGIKHGLMKQLVFVDDSGQIVRLAGVMGIVLAGGVVQAGDAVVATLPAEPHRAMQKV